MKFLGIWTIIVALSISVVAAYYSIVGLAAIFAASVIPIIIMGSVLEIGKITTAIWLHTFWSTATILMKTYLTGAVIVLMLITSMGIFGFLSKAHIEQSASGINVQAQIDRTDLNISRETAVINNSATKIANIKEQSTITDTNLKQKIVAQQELIKNIRARLDADINIQNNMSVAPSDRIITNELSRIRLLRTRLERAIANNNIKTIQRIIGTAPDGVFGRDTTTKLAIYRINLTTDIAAITAKLEAASNNVDKIKMQTAIRTLQITANKEIQLANNAINVYRNKQISSLTLNNNASITKQEMLIKSANTQIDLLLANKFELNSKLRQLAVEVGPVKYIAELVYGSATTDILEKAVRWVIILLVMVFDPLAIILILAGVKSLRTYNHIDNTKIKLYNKSTPVVILNEQVPDKSAIQEAQQDEQDEQDAIMPTHAVVDEQVPETSESTGAATIFSRK